MKFLKWLVLSAIIILIIAISANAQAETKKNWKLSASLYKTIALDQESIVQSGQGVQMSLHRKNLYLYLSKDKNQVRFAGQGGPDIHLWSAGVGMQHKVGDHLTLSVDVGWYKPVFGKMDEKQPYASSPFAEGLCRYLNEFLMPDFSYMDWEYYTLGYKGGFGGKLGLDFEYPITENILFNMTAGYRYLKVQEHVTGQDYDGGLARIGVANQYWTVRYDRNFSAFMIGGVLEYKF